MASPSGILPDCARIARTEFVFAPEMLAIAAAAMRRRIETGIDARLTAEQREPAIHRC